MTYATFTEHNDNEGETWRFYIPISGNEDALADLGALVDKTWSDAYELDLTPIDEAAVDARVALGDGGYMSAHNKLAGTLTVPTVETADDADDLLYKGGTAEMIAA